MPVKVSALIPFLLLGCGVPAPAPRLRIAEWRLSNRDGLLWIEPVRGRMAELEVRYDGPDRPLPGQIVSIEIRCPAARAGERVRFRIIPAEGDLRLLDPPQGSFVAPAAARVRFTSASPGAARLAVERLIDP